MRGLVRACFHHDFTKMREGDIEMRTNGLWSARRRGNQWSPAPLRRHKAGPHFKVASLTFVRWRHHPGKRRHTGELAATLIERTFACAVDYGLEELLAALAASECRAGPRRTGGTPAKL